MLVATDFSPASRTALVYGRALAGMFNAQLHVIHVVDDVSRFAYPVGTGLLPCQEMEADIRRVAWEQLDLFVDAGDRREKVVRLAPCPVLAVRQPEHEFVVAGAWQAEAHSTVSRI